MQASFKKISGAIDVTYADPCSASNHRMVYGSLASVGTYGWSGTACNLGTSGNAPFDPGAGEVFFVIVADDAAAEGSYGVSSAGTERPEAATWAPDLGLASRACRPQIGGMGHPVAIPAARAPRWLHAAAWLVLAWWTLRSGLTGRWIFLDFVNLAFHEAGHVLLSFAGTTVHFLGGTLGQLLVPGLLAFHFLIRQRQPMGAAFCLWWFGQNFSQISVYMADARELALPLVGGGDHDWNELFFRFGVLDAPSVARISGATRGLGVVVMLLGLVWTGWFALPDAVRERVRERSQGRNAWLDAALGE